jgi:hypothetical protein
MIRRVALLAKRPAKTRQSDGMRLLVFALTLRVRARPRRHDPRLASSVRTVDEHPERVSVNQQWE